VKIEKLNQDSKNVANRQNAKMLQVAAHVLAEKEEEEEERGRFVWHFCNQRYANVAA